MGKKITEGRCRFDCEEITINANGGAMILHINLTVGAGPGELTIKGHRLAGHCDLGREVWVPISEKNNKLIADAVVRGAEGGLAESVAAGETSFSDFISVNLAEPLMAVEI